VAAATGGRFDLLYLALGTSLSSTLIVVKLLSDKFELATFGGRVTLGILVFQDLFAIAFLAVQPNLQSLQPLILLRSLAAGLGLVAGAVLAARYLLPWYFRNIAKSPELMLVSAMAWCFLVAGTAGWAGLSKEMGALIAGVVIASYPYGTEVVSRIGGIRDFFITLFFVALGLKVPSPSWALVGLALAISIFVVVSRLVTMYGLFAALRLDTRTAGVVGVNLAQVSEFSLVIFTLGLGYGHISETANSLVLYTMLMTALFSTYGILYNHAVATRMAGVLGRLGLRRWFGDHHAGTGPGAGHGHGEGEGAEGDLFLLGVSREGLAFIQYLDRRDQALKSRVVAVDFNPETLERLTAAGVANHYGDISNPETLRHTGIERATVVVSGISDWFLKGTSNLQILRQVRGLAPEARVVVTADSPESAHVLYAAGAAYVIQPAALTAEHLHQILGDGSPQALARARRAQAGEPSTA
jgi:Kef-type K+ transport system membrane component KefB